MSLLRKIIIAVLLSFSFYSNSMASHATAVDLKYEHISGDTYKITLTFYRDCAGIPASNTVDIDIASTSGCGSPTSITLLKDSIIEVSPTCPALAQSTTCSGTGTFPGIQQHSYSAQYTFPSQCSDWVLSFSECTRNIMITNLVNPSAQCIYIEATLNNTNGYNDNSPVLTTVPVIYSCNNQIYQFNHGGYDPDGDSLVFTLVNALTAASSPITYVSPSNPTYPVVDTRGYNVFNNIDGSINFIPNGTQVDVMTMRVDEYRNGVIIGSTMRDMQLIVINCANQQPSNTTGIYNQSGGVLVDSNYIIACPGDSISFDLGYTDPDTGDSLFVYSNLATTIPDATFTYSGSNPVTIHFEWVPDVTYQGNNYFTFTIKDNSCPINVSQVYGYRIKVLPGTVAMEDGTFCPGGIQPVLHATGGSVFTWETISGDSIIVGTNFSCNPCANPVPTPSITTVYEVTSNLASGCKNKDTVTIRNEIDFTYNISPLDTFVCSSTDSIQIIINTSAGNYSYQWTPNINLNSDTAAAPYVQIEDSIIYEVVITNDSTGCRMLDSVKIDVLKSVDSINIVGDENICLGDTSNLELLAFNNYTPTCTLEYSQITYAPDLSTGFTTDNTTSNCDDCLSSPIQIGFDFDFYCSTYTSIYISSNGVVGFDPTNLLTFNNSSIPNSNPPNNIIASCWDDLNPSSSGTIKYKTTGTVGNRIFIIWYDNVAHFGSTGASVYSGQVKLFESDNSVEVHIINQNGTGSHTLGVENNTGTVGVSPSGYNNTGWTGSGIAFRFSYGVNAGVTTVGNLTWSNSIYLTDSTNTSTQAFPDSNMMFYATIIDSNCFNSVLQDSFFISVYDYPVTNITSSDSAICNGEPVTFSASGTASGYLWSNGSSNGTITLSPTSNTTYYLESNINQLCYVNDTISVAVVQLPNIQINGGYELCEGDSITLNATGGVEYWWSNGDTAESVTLVLSQGENIIVQGMNAFGCISDDNRYIFVRALPEVEINGDSVICLGDLAEIKVITNSDFVWGDGSTFDVINSSPQKDTIYTITATSNFGCITLDSFGIEVNPIPIIYITGDSAGYFGDEIILTANGGSNYEWKDGETTDQLVYVIDDNKSFFVTGIDSNGCVSYADFNITMIEDIIVPNIITPNNDDINEVFEILGIRENTILRIYNRWGKEIYENDDYKNDWTAEGLSDGIYYYQLIIDAVGEFKGWVEVSR